MPSGGVRLRRRHYGNLRRRQNFRHESLRRWNPRSCAPKKSYGLAPSTSESALNHLASVPLRGAKRNSLASGQRVAGEHTSCSASNLSLVHRTARRSNIATIGSWHSAATPRSRRGDLAYGQHWMRPALNSAVSRRLPEGPNLGSPRGDLGDAPKSGRTQRVDGRQSHSGYRGSSSLGSGRYHSQETRW